LLIRNWQVERMDMRFLPRWRRDSEKGLRHRDEGDEGDSKKGMEEVAARQNFGAVGLGLTLASELAM
jgi:hypothetical protein